MIIATFRAQTPLAGQVIRFEDGAFRLNDRYLTATQVLSTDDLVDWAYEGIREWVRALTAVDGVTESTAGAPSAEPDPPPASEPVPAGVQEKPQLIVSAPDVTVPIPGPDAEVPPWGQSFHGYYLVADTRVAVLQQETVEMMVEIAHRAVAERSASGQASEKVEALSAFGNRLMRAVTSNTSNAMRLDIGAVEQAITTYLQTQVLVRTEPSGLRYVCRTCRHSWTVNPEYEKLRQKQAVDGTLLRYATAAAMVPANPVLAFSGLFGARAQSRGLDMRCPRCKRQDLDETGFVYCPRCGAECGGAIIKVCPRCKHDLSSEHAAAAADIWLPRSRQRVPGETAARVAETRLSSAPTAMAFLPDGVQIVIATSDRCVQLLDISALVASGNGARPVWSVLLAIKNAHPIMDVSFDGSLVATGAHWTIRRGCDNVTILRTQDGGVWGTIPVTGMGLRDLSFSPDGRVLAMACGAEIEFKDLYGGPPPRVPLPAPMLDGIDWMPDGAGVATCEGNGIRIRSLWDGLITLEFTLDAKVRDIAVSRDGARIAAACADRTARVFEVNSGNEVARVVPEHDIAAVAFAANDRLAITGDGTALSFWSLAEL